MDALNRSEVPIETMPKELVALSNAQSQKSRLFFTDADLPSEGPNHNKQLHGTVRFHRNTILVCLVDNGSTLNLCPLWTAVRLGLNESNFAPSN